MELMHGPCLTAFASIAVLADELIAIGLAPRSVNEQGGSQAHSNVKREQRSLLELPVMVAEKKQ